MMNWNLMLQVATTIILKLIASCLCLMYSNCPARWHPFGGKCYFFSTATQTWSDSLDTCKQLSSLLAVVNSEEELTFLKSKASNGMYFIGLTHRDGRWTWIDGTKFDSNIFNLTQGKAECVVVGFHGFVEPAFCYVPYRFICEKNA